MSPYQKRGSAIFQVILGVSTIMVLSNLLSFLLQTMIAGCYRVAAEKDTFFLSQSMSAMISAIKEDRKPLH